MQDHIDDALKSVRDLRFEALRNAIYHTARRSFLDRCNKLCNFIVIMAGATAIADFGVHLYVTPQVLVAIATASATLQLVFDFGGKARDHEFLQRRYYALLAKIEVVTKKNEAMHDLSVREILPHTADWYGELYGLYAEEPPPLRALEVVAYNAACNALGKNARVQITFMQSVFRHFYPFNGTNFSTSAT